MVSPARSNDLPPHVPDAHEALLAEESIRQLAHLARQAGDVRLRVVGEVGDTATITIPSSAFRLLMRIPSELARGDGVSMMAHHAELTTQQAADILNVSRSYLVKLLERGEMPFRWTGTHRRVRLDDVLDYKRTLDERRRETLDELAELTQERHLDGPAE